MDQETSDAIESAIKDIIGMLNPDVRYLAKYGGKVLALDPHNDSQFVGGIFIYKDHVSLEFSQGASFDDPHQRLQGKGKSRRHLKFQTLGDVKSNGTESFLKQAILS